MKHISSRENPIFKELKLLATMPQARRKLGRTLLDGVHLCEVYLQEVGMPAMCVVSEDALRNREVEAVFNQCEAAAAPCIVLPDVLYRALSQVEHGVGLQFVVAVPRIDMRLPLDRSAVLLDNLQDPGNLGSILRSAAAAGIEYVFCSQGTASAWSPKVLRAGMGAHFLLKIFENVDLHRLMASSAVPILATSSHATQTVFNINLSAPSAWIFGHEGQGIAPALLELASQKVAIPHLGRVESLNVAASAAICLFEQVRQRVGR